MAIEDDEIKDHCGGSRPDLIEFESPEESDDDGGRALYLAYEVHDLIKNASERDPRWSQAKARFEAFVEGRPVQVRRFGRRKDRDKSQPSVFAYLPPRKGEPDHVWEFRIRINGLEQLRIFGLFTRRDSFIALVVRDRDNLDYAEAMRDCYDAWARMFGVKSPHKGKCANDYLSKAQPVP